jgi:flagellar protein FlaI
MVPRPDPDEAGREEVERILAEAEDLFAEYRGRMPDSVADALLDVAPARNVEAQPVADREALAQAVDEAAALDEELSAAGETDETDEIDVPEERRTVADATPPIEGFEAGFPAEGTVADGSDARDGDRTGDTSDGESAGDTDDADGGIDFDEPFDEGIDVLDSNRGFGPAREPNPNPAPDTNPEQADSGVRADADGGVTEGEAKVEDAESDGGDVDDDATQKASGDTDPDESEDDTAAEDEGEDDDGNNADNIDDWGFGSVESPEER